METAHSFRSIRARIVYLISLYSTGSPLRAVILVRQPGRDRQVRALHHSICICLDYEDAELHPLVLAIRRPFRVECNAIPDPLSRPPRSKQCGVTRVVLVFVILWHGHHSEGLWHGHHSEGKTGAHKRMRA
jgi:hypothetical protein